MKNITRTDIDEMVNHWLQTPVCGYLGSDYGQDLKSILQRPFGDGSADAQIAKLKSDVEVLQALPSTAVNIYAVPAGVDKLSLVIEVAGSAIEVK